MPLSANTPAPEFHLADETGTVRSLEDFRGHALVLYFYPKDDTPGCTVEACAFRDDYSAYAQAGVTILGVSPDSPKAHTRFKAKFQLPFSLLADEEHAVCLAYQAWGPKKMMGREYEGVLRTTYLIDAQGMIINVWPNVKPDGHSAQILAAIK